MKATTSANTPSVLPMKCTSSSGPVTSRAANSVPSRTRRYHQATTEPNRQAAASSSSLIFSADLIGIPIHFAAVFSVELLKFAFQARLDLPTSAGIPPHRPTINCGPELSRRP